MTSDAAARALSDARVAVVAGLRDERACDVIRALASQLADALGMTREATWWRRDGRTLRANRWRAVWVDPTFVDDPDIDHEDEQVQRLAAALHDREIRTSHDPAPPVACVPCARRATVVVREIYGTNIR